MNSPLLARCSKLREPEGDSHSAVSDSDPMAYSVHGILSRPGYGYPIPSPEDLANPGVEPGSPALQVDSLPTEPQGKPGELEGPEILHYVV